MSPSLLLYFLGASAALTLAPGPDNTFIIAQGISRGRKAAIISALGMCSGVSVHTTAAALGISAAIYSSASAFLILKYAGAAYLLYLAFKAIREPAANPCACAAETGQSLHWKILFRRGFLMNVMNPKVGIFFLAFLPQFVLKEAGNIPWQIFLLGIIFMLQGIVLFTGIGYLSGSIGNRLLARPNLARRFNWLSAAIFLALAIRLALATR